MIRTSAPGLSIASADTRYSQLPTSKVVTPTTGQTVSFDNNSVDQILVVNPAGSIAALTITFPSDASSRIGQIARIAAMQPVALVTMSGATILNANTSLATNDIFCFVKININTWGLQQ